MTPGLAALPVLVALVVLLWPRGRAVTVRRPGGSSAPGEAGSDPGALGARGHLRRLWSAEVRRGGAPAGWVAEFAELSAVGLEAGLPVVEAARLACAVGAGDGVPRVGHGRPGATGSVSGRLREVGELIAATQDDGGRLGDALREAARGDRDLAFLAAAWRLSEELGTASAPAARLSAEVLRERSASAERQAVLAAGPRASMWLLTLLPLTGPLVALLLGLPVSAVYGTGAAASATAAGLCLTGLGWAWSRRLLRRSLRPAVVR